MSDDMPEEIVVTLDLPPDDSSAEAVPAEAARPVAPATTKPSSRRAAAPSGHRPAAAPPPAPPEVTGRVMMPPPHPLHAAQGGFQGFVRGFNPWERRLLVLFLLLLLMSSGTYFSGYSIRRLLFGWSDEDSGKTVGQMKLKKGSVLRQTPGGGEFEKVSEGATLFNGDTIMTSTLPGTQVVFDTDHGELVLGPETLIRLDFADGLAAKPRIELVVGAVKAKGGKTGLILKSKNGERDLKEGEEDAAETAKAPPPLIPLASQVHMISPKVGDRLRVEERSEPIHRVVRLEWKVDVVDAPLEIRLLKLPEPGREALEPPTEMFRRVTTSPKGEGATTATLLKPGTYEWSVYSMFGELLPGGGGDQLRSRFTLEPEFEAIVAQEPQIEGRARSKKVGEDDQIDEFAVGLKWQKPFFRAVNYNVTFADSASFSHIERTKATDTEVLNLDPSEVSVKKVWYRVASPVGDGFRAVSPVQTLLLKFPAPIPALPQNQSVLSRKEYLLKRRSLLLTWQRNRFANEYDLDVATDPGFERIFRRQKVKENFIVFTQYPANAVYYWRVRSLAREIKSPYSQVFTFKLGD